MAAFNGAADPIPTNWLCEDCLTGSHHAPMHLLFLGLTKTTFHMLKQWLELHGAMSMFTMQLNPLLESIMELRLSHFQAHKLTVSGNGTGAFVSENHLCMARMMKCLLTMPVITEKRQKIAKFRKELPTVEAICASLLACIGRIMSDNRFVEKMELSIHVCLNCVVEMDKCLNPKLGKSLSKGQKRKQPNFMKSNMLGLLGAARSHDHFEPARHHWEEGSWEKRQFSLQNQN